MTFSDKRVAEIVNAHFVAAWHNRGAGFHNEDYSTERWIFTSAMEAYPTKNICTFFMAPDGKVFHYLSGYYSPDVFETYLQVALRMRSAAFDERMQLKAGGLEALRQVHGEVVKIVEGTQKEIARTLGERDGWKKVLADYRTYGYREVKHEHTARCAHNLNEGYRYLAKVHGHWSEVKALPDFPDVQFSYLWGNPFTEESPGSRQIRGDDDEERRIMRCGERVIRKCGCE